MSILGRLFLYFPSVTVFFAAASLVACAVNPSPTAAFILLLSLYGFPLFVFRLLVMFYPIKEGLSDLRNRAFSPWWASHQIQAIYIAYPMLENVLRLVPGLFSVWLRLWGSRIGKGVHWSPRIDILDRSLLDIGDKVIFGHEVKCFGHVIKKKNSRLLLFAKRIAIGNDVFIGAGSRLGPGVTISGETVVPLLSDLYVNKRFHAAIHTEPSHVS